jgi:hypothetical protein
VLGFITELKSALTVVLVTTPFAPFAGDVAITVGNAGLGACSRPHPATRAAHANNTNDMFRSLKFRTSSSMFGERSHQSSRAWKARVLDKLQAAVFRLGFTCGLRSSAVGLQPHDSPDRSFSFCRYALGREGPFEGYCSEGVERYEFIARVTVRQRNSRELSF